MRNFNRIRLSSSSALRLTGVAAALFSTTPGWTQTVASGPIQIASAEDAPASGDIIVTARKRAEDVLKTPVTVNVKTAADIATRQIVSIKDLAKDTPGFDINNSSSGRQDRSFQSFIVRGATPGSVNFVTASTFIDGVPVASTTALESIDDPARVELLKGPQSAYFGRQTFAGALNVVTKTPGDAFHGSVSALGGTRSSYDVGARLSGPILGDMLGFTASVRQFARDGSYHNASDPGQTLGDQKTFSATGGLVFHPSDNLTVKALGIYIKDHDGPSADGLVSDYTVTSSTGTTYLRSQSNCTFSGYSVAAAYNGTAVATRPRVSNPGICGRVPSLLPGSLTANTTNDSVIQNFLQSPTGRLIDPKKGVQGYGLRRAFYHAHLIAEYTVPGTSIVLSSLSGYNHEYFSELDDLDNYDGRNVPNVTFAGTPISVNRNYFDFPFLIERRSVDASTELRLTSGQAQRFRWMVGGSYLWNRIDNGGGGSNAALLSSVNASTVNRTLGGFFALAYDIVPKLTINVEGRYQRDKLAAINGQSTTLTDNNGAPIAPFSKITQSTFKNFIPRAILNYQATPDLLLYASYAKGLNPGTLNTGLYAATLAPAVRSSLASQGFGPASRPEKLDNYEIGVKGKLMGGKIRYALSAYYAQWKDQITQTSVNVIATNALTGVTAPLILTFNLNDSRTNLKGIELDSTITPFDGLAINLAASINDSSIKNYVDYKVSTTTGVLDFHGNQLPNTSKYSAAVGAQYGQKFNGSSTSDWYVRGDFFYKSGLYTDASNVAKTAPQKIVNARLGVNFGNFNVEGFVTNVFNNRAYTSISNNSLLTPPNFPYSAYNSYLNVGLPDLRTFGGRVKFRF